jgi:hypothetical protein
MVATLDRRHFSSLLPRHDQGVHLASWDVLRRSHRDWCVPLSRGPLPHMAETSECSHRSVPFDLSADESRPSAASPQWPPRM